MRCSLIQSTAQKGTTVHSHGSLSNYETTLCMYVHMYVRHAQIGIQYICTVRIAMYLHTKYTAIQNEVHSSQTTRGQILMDFAYLMH
jgi:hypothetical protein